MYVIDKYRDNAVSSNANNAWNVNDNGNANNDNGVRPADSFETEVYELKGHIEKP